MRNTDNIERMENILNDTNSIITELNAVLDKLNRNLSDYKALSDYYSSEERTEDLEDDEKGLLPSDLRRGVLSEDAIWNLGTDYQEAAMQMMETAIKMLRNN